MRLQLMSSAALSIGVLIAQSTSANACGGPLDIACNVGKTIEKATQDTGRTIGNTWDQGREDANNGLNRISPSITKTMRDIDRARINLQSEVISGPALEQWINQTYSDLIGGSAPIPAEVRNAMRGWYSDQQIADVRYKVGDGGDFNLSFAAMHYGTAVAITFKNLIIFKDNGYAHDLATWPTNLSTSRSMRTGVCIASLFNTCGPGTLSRTRPTPSRTHIATVGGPPPNNGMAGGQGGPGPVQQVQLGNICRIGPQQNQACIGFPFLPLNTPCTCRFPNGNWNGTIAPY